MTHTTIRIQDHALKALYEANPEFDVRQVKFHHPDDMSALREQLAATGLDDDGIATKVTELKTWQRLLNLHPDVNVAQGLISRGIVCANQLARIPLQTFVQTHAQSLGMSAAEATEMHQRAVGVRNSAMHLWASVSGTVASPFYRYSAMDTVSPELKETFQNLPSYQDMFGSLDYCNCPECRSIFGPAAYLVDLLRIIDQYVTTPNRATIDDAFLFTARRPDIWTIPLDCGAANDAVPYLQIVNERLTVRAELVTGQGVLEQLATTLVYPQALPFNAPLDQIRVLLDKLGCSYGQVLSAWSAAASTVAAQTLGLSADQQRIVTTALTVAAEIAPYYNVSDISTLSVADTFMASTWMNYAQMLTLLEQDLSATEQQAGLQVNFFLNQGLGGKWVALSQPAGKPAQLDNLTATALDSINRLQRLATQLGNPAAEVDWALRCVQGGNMPVISDDSLIALQQLLAIADRLGLDLPTACSLAGPIKTYGQGADEAGPQFDRLFNSPAILASNAPYHPSGNPLNTGYTDTPLTWTPGSSAAEDIHAINRVLPGLGISLSDANALGLALVGENAQQTLTVQTLSDLYRHALLSRTLQLPMSRYLLLLKLAGVATPATPGVQEIAALVGKVQWLNQAGLSVYQLDYFINGVASVYVNPLYQPDNTTVWQQGLWVTVPAGTASTGSDITAQVAVLFGVNNPLATTAMSMAVAAVALPAGATDWETAFLAAQSDGKTPEYASYVQTVLKWVSRWLVLAQSLNLADTTLANVAVCPAAYQLPTNFAVLGWEAISNIWQVQQMMQSHGDLQQNLLLYIQLVSTGAASDTSLLVLQKATGWDPVVVASLLSGPLQAVTVVTLQLNRLQTCIDVMSRLGANPGFMQSMVNVAALPAKGNWATWSQSAAAVLAKTASIYGTQWESVWTPLSGDLAVHLRDALLSLVLSQLNSDDPTIKTARNVYEFLLTDVEMGAATTISYIVEALNAAQLYLQRCRLQLEPGVLDLTQIQDPWWEWMMNYRVWQANREIFVYPENYLIPSLRKNTTPQFTALVQSLQQSDVNKAYVGAAFTTYINSFSEVAELKPVDAYRTKINDSNRIYLLSRSKTAPYTFYYCQQTENMPWTPWEKIDLTINSANCTLVYAFSRPFLFWNEIKKNNTSSVSGSPSEVTTTNSVTYTASVMYSFLNQEGKWVQPQTLVDQDVVLFRSDDTRNIALMNNAMFDGLFDMAATCWNKVFAFNVDATNYVEPPPFKAEAERLVVMYGPNVLDTGDIWVTKNPSSPTSDPSASSFWLNLRDRAEDHNRMVMGQLSGNMNLRPVAVLNLSLEGDVLVQRQELLLADPYIAKTPLSLIHAEIQSSGDVLQVTHRSQPITDNRNVPGTVGLTVGSKASAVNGNSFIGSGISATQSLQIYQALQAAKVIDATGNVLPQAMATLDLYSVLSGITAYGAFSPLQFSAVQQVLFDHLEGSELFGTIAGNCTKVVPVGTQPGWFLFFVQDEIFLLSPENGDKGQPAFSSFAEGLTVGDPLIEPTFAIMTYQGTSPGSINAVLSRQIYTILTQYNLVKDGRLAAGVTVAYLQAILLNMGLTDAQYQYILNALRNYPVIFDDAFISDKITYAVSQQIYVALQTMPPLIDPNGRIDMEHLTGANVQLCLGNLLLSGTITQSQIAGIYRTLAQAPKAIVLTYQNHGAAVGYTTTGDFHFNVTRLSTSAISKISRALFVGGVDSLLNLKIQQIPVLPVLPFERFTPSTTGLNWPSALDATQVDFDGLYGQYFWEIFYHIPMLVAAGLNTNQQFQEAQTWLQYVFNPTEAEQFVTAATIVDETEQAIALPQADTIITQLKQNPRPPASPILNASGEVNPTFTATTSLSFLQSADPTLTTDQLLMVRNILLNYQLSAPASHFWNFRPFRNHTLQSLQEMLSDSNPAVKVYNDDPFDPFAIARLRIGAFEKSTLMQYIDNLLAWGDQLFIQDSWESITGAYMLYVYAYDLLGPRPQLVGECAGDGIVLNFEEIKAKYPDGIPQFLIDLENFIPGGSGSTTPMLGHAFNDLYVYFCVPENSDLMQRWDTAEDRMYKINHSLNIDGVYRSLALFQPPLNPLDLVRAAAAGNNVMTGASSSVQLTPYRFTSAIGAAQNLCNILIELGSALLSVLEKNDAEALAALRNNQEGQILEMNISIKTERISEIQANILSLTASQTGAASRLTYYTDMLNNGLSGYEQTSLDATAAALAANILGSISKTAATIAYAVPQVGSPFAMTYGGVQLGSAVNASSGVFEIGAEISSFISQRAATMGGYERRSQEWSLQKQIAQADSDSIAQQLVAANLQLQSAQQDLAVQQKSIAQNQVIERYLQDKFSNQDLYQWMAGRLSAVYFQTWALGLQAAQQAQASYQFETDSNQSFLSFDYWDSLHKGLTAGEGLRLALNRMEAAWRTGDKRSLEIEKTISLAMIAPEQLLKLKSDGACSFSLSEALFDYDYPGHYSRKITTISLSIPAVIGPYQNIKAVLTQTKNSIATTANIDEVKYLLSPVGEVPQGIRQDWAHGQSIAVSRGVDDSGLFTLDFQDPRYLPFENTGAVSDWTLSMPLDTNRFDFGQLSDVIITLRYTALSDDELARQVRGVLAQTPLLNGIYVDGGMQSTAWQTFMLDHSDAKTQTLTLDINPAQLGYFKSLTYNELVLQLTTATGITLAANATFMTIASGNNTTTPSFTDGKAVVDALNWNGKTAPTTWTFKFDLTNPSIAPLLSDGFIDGSKLLDLQVVALYAAKIF
ncbi:hypothetical protein WP5S18E01_22730 [Enterobacter cloacae]|nr:hypothetical protein WP5S18E01_22730 [Enterobacter cloacae]